jgi:Rho GTPase-activating protein 39
MLKQNTALARRLSKTISSAELDAIYHIPTTGQTNDQTNDQLDLNLSSRRSPRAFASNDRNDPRHNSYYVSKPPNVSQQKKINQSSISSVRNGSGEHTRSSHAHQRSGGSGLTLISQLPPIPGSPYNTDSSAPSTPSSARHSLKRRSSDKSQRREEEVGSVRDSAPFAKSVDSGSYHPSRSPPLSLDAVVGLFAQSQLSPTSSNHSKSMPDGIDNPLLNQDLHTPVTPIDTHPSPSSAVRRHGKEISGPVLNSEAMRIMNPVKKHSEGRPIMVEKLAHPAASVLTLRSG